MSTTFSVSAVAGAYVINGSTSPTLQVVRGQTYTFSLSVTGHPFQLETVSGAAYAWSGNGQETGSHDWTVPTDAPNDLRYQCGNHSYMGGSISVSGTVTPSQRSYPEKVIRSQLVADSAVSGYIGSRVYPMIAPQSATLPWICFRRSSISRETTMGNPMGVPTVSLELQVFAETYEDAREIADAVRLVLDGFSGSQDNVVIRHTSLEAESDDFVQIGSDSLPVFQVTQSYDILWQES